MKQFVTFECNLLLLVLCIHNFHHFSSTLWPGCIPYVTVTVAPIQHHNVFLRQLASLNFLKIVFEMEIPLGQFCNHLWISETWEEYIIRWRLPTTQPFFQKQLYHPAKFDEIMFNIYPVQENLKVKVVAMASQPALLATWTSNTTITHAQTVLSHFTKCHNFVQRHADYCSSTQFVLPPLPESPSFQSSSKYPIPRLAETKQAFQHQDLAEHLDH